MAGLQNIDMDQIDAALVDGANGWQRLWYIIIPGLRHVLTMITTFTLILGVNVFDIVWITTRGGPGRATHVIATFTYTTAFRESYVGYGSALAIVMALVSLVAVFHLYQHYVSVGEISDMASACRGELSGRPPPEPAAELLDRQSSLQYGMLILFALYVLVPFMWVVFTALKTNFEIAQDPLGLPPNWRFENIATAWNRGQVRPLFH